MYPILSLQLHQYGVVGRFIGKLMANTRVHTLFKPKGFVCPESVVDHLFVLRVFAQNVDFALLDEVHGLVYLTLEGDDVTVEERSSPKSCSHLADQIHVARSEYGMIADVEAEHGIEHSFF